MVMGRPKAITEQVIQKLEEAFSMAYTDGEACLYANIGKSTLYDYCKAHPDFSERKEILKKQPNMLAKRNIKKSLEDGDVKTSMWQQEKTDKAYNPTKVIEADVNQKVSVDDLLCDSMSYDEGDELPSIME